MGQKTCCDDLLFFSFFKLCKSFFAIASSEVIMTMGWACCIWLGIGGYWGCYCM